jgi:hypothetical protein
MTGDCLLRNLRIDKEKKEMGFKITAMIANKKSEITPPEINLSTFGVRKGEEITDHNCPDGILTKIRDQFKQMAKAKKGKQIPMSLSWLPTDPNKSLFANLKKAKLRITVTIERYDKSAKWMLVFDDVEMIGSPKPDFKKFKDFTRKDERIDAAFLRFEDDPS